MSDQVLHVGDTDFEAQVLKSETPVLVDFWAEWCGPCKMIGPIVDELANTYAGKVKVVKLNIDHNPMVPRQYACDKIEQACAVGGGNGQHPALCFFVRPQ